MKSTGQNARSGMYTFVAVIAVIAAIIAIGYFVFFHPGTPVVPAPG